LQELNKIIRFLTYTNSNLGFTIKYPSDWAIDEGSIVSGQTVRFTSANGGGNVAVVIQDATSEETGIATVDDFANYLISHLSPGAKLLQLYKNGYFLSGHHAIRRTLVQSYGGPGQPTSPNMPPHDVKMMGYNLFLGEKRYNVIYGITPPEDFPRYLQTAQSMIDSFQITG
jgi:hypothetical protein